jgi:hypothetical protein
VNPFHQIPVGGWQDEPAFVIGGGPSVGDISHANHCTIASGRVIAVNNAFKLFPRADYLLWADKQWYEWNSSELEKFQGKHLLTTSHVKASVGGPRFNDVERIRRTPEILSKDGDRLAGFSSGAQALNLAWLLKANPIFLAGFEMTPGSWHNEHKIQADEQRYRMFRDDIESMLKEIRRWSQTQVYLVGHTAIREGASACSLTQSIEWTRCSRQSN